MTREELKQADTEKLISALQYCGRDSYYATYYDEVVDEITQRLKRIAELEKENAELEQQIEKMKCCGNCKHCKYSESEESYEWCEKHDQVVNIAIKPCYAYEMFDLDKAIKEIEK